MNKEAIDALIKSKPQLKLYRSTLEKLQPGTFVVHRSWGLGRIREYDSQENKLVIDFEEDGREGHTMDPAFCATKLEILPANNIVVRQRAEPEAVEKMIKENPADLIIEILQQSPDNQATTREIEAQLTRLMGDRKYRKWWTATKKVLVRDPRVATPNRKTEPYVLREEPLSAEEEVLEDFYRTKNSKSKITLAERLLEVSTSHEELIPKLPDVLKELAEVLKGTLQLNQGERLHGIWVRNDLARFLHDDPESLEPTSASLLEEHPDLNVLAAEIPSTYQKRFLDLAKRVFPERWKSLTFDLLKNSSGRFTQECVSFLVENGCADELADTLQRWLNEQALKGPLLHWILKNRHSRRYQTMIAPLLGPRLLNAIFYAVDYEALHNASTKRIPLADYLADDQELIPELIGGSTVETARDLANNLMLNQGFPDLDKKSLLARFIRLFPSIQNIVAGESETERDQLVVSVESYNRVKQEYEELINTKIPENKKAIEEAREMGDLRENSEYKMARQDNEMLMARKAQLERDLSRARTTDFTDAPPDTVGVGSTVELEEASTGNVVTYAILGAWDSDPEKNILSYQTPLARNLISRKVGESVQSGVDENAETYTLRSIGRYVDQLAEKV